MARKGKIDENDTIKRFKRTNQSIIYQISTDRGYTNLLRYWLGYELIEYFCSINNIELEIIDNTETSKEKELTDDLIQIITVFANRLYGQRSKKTKRLIHEVKNNANSD